MAVHSAQGVFASRNLIVTLAILVGGAVLVAALYATPGKPGRPAQPLVGSPPRARIHVEIHFPGESLEAYMDEIADQDILNGGTTLTRIYDAQGHPIGVVNYGKVNYIRRLP